TEGKLPNGIGTKAIGSLAYRRRGLRFAPTLRRCAVVGSAVTAMPASSKRDVKADRVTPAFLERGCPDPALSRLRLGSEAHRHGLVKRGQAMTSAASTKVQEVLAGRERQSRHGATWSPKVRCPGQVQTGAVPLFAKQ